MKFLKNKTFKHGEGTGDLIYSLPTVIALGGGEYYIYVNLTSVSKLMELQPYITAVHLFQGTLKEYSNLKVDYNLDEFRQQNFNQQILIKCHLMAFNVNFNMEEPFIFNIEPKRVASIIINHTGKRTPGDTVDFSILKKYENHCKFVGYENEYKEFIEKHNLDISRAVIKDVLEFAQVIKGSDLYIANQSLGFSLAEGMKHPRVLDVYTAASKQHPQGSYGYESLSEEIINRYLQ